MPLPESPVTAAESLVRRDRWVVALCLLLLCLLSWYYLFAGAGTGMSTVAMSTWQFPPPIYDSMGQGNWSPAYWGIMLLMWWVMMIAMMVPSAAPMILLYARVCRRHQPEQRSVIPTAYFLLGYVIAWLVFSVVATLLQWCLEQAGLVHSMMMWSSSYLLSAGFLLAAGIYQLSPLKAVCLQHCRSPAGYLSANWRKGRSGALQMGLRHGIFCVGCCWFLMLLLFVGGIMNLVWIAGLAIFVLLEKMLPHATWIARGSGLFMLLLAGYLVVVMDATSK